MATHDDKGTVKIGSRTIQQGSKGTSKPPPSSTQSRRVKDVQEKNLQKKSAYHICKFHKCSIYGKYLIM